MAHLCWICRRPFRGKPRQYKRRPVCRQCWRDYGKPKTTNKRSLFKAVTYRGFWVMLYEVGNGPLGEPKLKGEFWYEKRTPRVPPSKVIDLNTYLPGFRREQIKRMKAMVLSKAESALGVRVGR